MLDEMLDELKHHLRITWYDEDEELEALLLRGQSAFKRLFGVDVDYSDEGLAYIKELLYNWCRYARNNSLEYFQQNFQSEINTIAFSLAAKEREANDED